MKTTSLKAKDVKRNWYVVDCTDKVIGRVSTEVAKVLQGKHKSNYAPNLDNGDCVILLNTSKITWTGKKEQDKVYKKHTGFQGGLKERTLGWMINRNPNVVLEHSIYKMLPKNKMRDVYMSHLYCYKDDVHKHEAQQPQTLEIK